MTMAEKHHPTRALAAYFRALVRHNRGVLPLDELPSRAGEVTMQARNYVLVGTGSRILAVYRVKPSGLLQRLKRWPKELALRP